MKKLKGTEATTFTDMMGVLDAMEMGSYQRVKANNKEFIIIRIQNEQIKRM